MLSNSDLVELVAFRRELHRWPEVSGKESETAGRVVSQLTALKLTEILTDLGGHGVAAVFVGAEPGPTVLFRCELDALPITDIGAVDRKSNVPGNGHLCGHDGHMTMILALGRILSRNPVARGRVVLMFQPAEEDGSGARAVVADPAFDRIKPDWAFSIHNVPGFPIGHLGLRAGLVNCASRGLRITLNGKTSHASEPEAGVSPQAALTALMPALSALGTGGALDDTFRLATITHAQLGEPSFGISPGAAVIQVTLRATTDPDLEDMTQKAMALAGSEATRHGLELSVEDCDIFAASINHPDAVQIAARVVDSLGLDRNENGLPMRGSEDFGVFGWAAKSAMMMLGAGLDQPALHNPDYDFPDDLIPIGAAIFDGIAREILG